jgi:hypothetical protein
VAGCQGDLASVAGEAAVTVIAWVARLIWPACASIRNRNAPAGEPRFVRLVARFTYPREVVTALIDSVLRTLAYYSAYRLRFEENFHAHEPYFAASLALVLVCQIAAFAAFRVYRGVWRYTGVSDLVRLTQAVSFGTGAAVRARGRVPG